MEEGRTNARKLAREARSLRLTLGLKKRTVVARRIVGYLFLVLEGRLLVCGKD